MTLAHGPLQVRREVREHLRRQLLMLSSDFVVEYVWACLVFDDASLPECEIVIPRAERKDSQETVADALTAGLEAAGAGVRLLIVRELRSSLATILTIEDRLLVVFISTVRTDLMTTSKIHLHGHLPVVDASVKNDRCPRLVVFQGQRKLLNHFC